MISSKAAIVMSSIIEKLQLIFGGLLIFTFGILTIASFADSELAGGGFLWFCLVCDIIGVVLIIFSNRRRKLIIEFKKYVAILSADSSGSIENLASAAGVSPDVIKRNLGLMIKRKYFINAHIDHGTNRIIISLNKDFTSNLRADQDQEGCSAELITVTCRNCGGINKIVRGKVFECEFCGSPIRQEA